MITEHALLEIIPGKEQQFEKAMTEALPLIRRQPGFLWAKVLPGIEHPNVYLLLVGWESVEHHEQGFRGSPEYQRWRELLHGFYDPFPRVTHFGEFADVGVSVG